MIVMFRKNLKTFVTIITAMIIPGFVFWGVGSAIRAKIAARAGKLWGKTISVKDFNNSFSAVESQMMLLYGKMYNRLAQFFDFKNLAWDRLILLEEARKKGVFITQSELIHTIKNIPYFQYKKKFSKERYETIIQRFFRITAENFEQRQRENLMIQKRRDQINKSIFVSHNELKDSYRLENEKISIDVLQFFTKKYSQQFKNIDESQLKKFFRENSKRFLVSLQRKVCYVHILSQEQSCPKYTTKDAYNYYNANKKLFEIKKKKNPKNQSSKNVQVDKKQEATKTYRPFEEVKANIMARMKKEILTKKAKDKAILISENLLDNIPIKDIENQHSVQFVKTPFFNEQGKSVLPTKKRIPYEIWRPSFSLKVGDSGDIIPSRSGFFVIKVIEEKAPYIPEFAIIQKKVTESFRLEKGSEVALNKAKEVKNKILKLTKEGLSFKDSCKKINLIPLKPDPFARNGRIPEISSSQNLAQIAFSLSQDHPISDPIESSSGFILITLDKKYALSEKEISQKSLEEKFSKKIINQKRSVVYKNWIQMVKKRAHLEKNSKYFQD